jgi:hypothetical protein
MNRIEKELDAILDAVFRNNMKPIRRNISTDLFWELDAELIDELRNQLTWDLPYELETLAPWKK